ncbi:sodium:glutamate symporter [Steroidobacter denitrificans]|uniref:Sodium/glutamate symporter n=1 Tax=Steroidobacter denitrificans TaxID=465721 RepID=A0A127F7A9_STEDE|nr:sodium/glutamate symporter [Steroidobacter denitrificans]AMN46287.1 sodium:glutamate symporter [Steroidobacter denitrificans]
MSFDLVATVALSGGLLFVGYGMQRLIPWLARLNIPAPVIGGLIASVAVLFARIYGLPVPMFDTTLQRPLLVAFFTTIGFSASVALLRVGGPQVALLLVIVTVFAILQNLMGMGIAIAFGQDPLFGVLTGSVTLMGGPATGLAFAPLFEAAGVEGAASIAIAAAMAGIVIGGLVGGPVATFLIERHRLRGPRAAGNAPVEAAAMQVRIDPQPALQPEDDAARAYVALKTVVIVLMAMWSGSWISAAINSTGVTLPEYIGAMLAAALIRNFDDRTGWIGLPHAAVDLLGAVALSLFLVMALMTLDLTQLAGLALPLIVILTAQLALVAALSIWPIFQLLGRDYDAAVTTGGTIGFALGTTANAMAVMRTLVERFGASPRAFLVAPLVGAFFIDFTNALVITGFLNLFG